MLYKKKKSNSNNNIKESIRKKPFLVKYRSSNLYVFITASFSIFTGSILYSIIIPILPFIIDAMNRGVLSETLDPKSNNNILSPYNNQTILSTDTTGSFDAGVILGLYSAASVVTSPIFGYLGDKVTYRRTPMLFGILALFATTLLFLFATHFWMLALARVLQGISDACVYTLSLTLVSDTFPSEVIGTQLGRVMLFQSIGIAAGTPIGVLFDKLGYRGPFIFSIILAVIDFFLRLFLIERRNNPKHWFVHNDSDMITNDRFRDERIVNYSTIPEFALGCKHSKKKNNSIVKEEWGVDRYNNDEGEEGVVISKKQVFTNKSSDQEPDATTNNNNCSLESSSLSPNQTVVDHNRDLVIITDVCENGIDERKKKKSNNMSTIQLLCNSRILVALLFSLLPFLAISMLEPTLPIRLAHEWDYNPSQIGLVFLAQILPSFLAVPLSGYLYDRYGAKLLCFITMFISAIVIGFLGVPSRYQSNNNHTTTVLGEGIIPLVVLITLFGFFINMIYTPAYAEVSTAWSSCFFVPSTGTDDDEVENKEKDGSGKSYGFISAVVCLGNFLGPVLGGYLFETIGFFWLSITVGCILLLFSPFSLVFLTSKTIY